MKMPANLRILTINGGSSSIKFALFEAGNSLRRILEGGNERIGCRTTSFSRPLRKWAEPWCRHWRPAS
jgi:acetate kinase